MVSLIRNSSRTLFITTTDKSAFSESLCSSFETEMVDAHRILDKSTEYQTVLFIRDNTEVGFDSASEIDAFIVYEESLSFTCKIIASPINKFILSIRTGPQMIIMRTVGDLEKVLIHMHSDFGGEIATYEDYLNEISSNATFVGLTEKPLNRNVELSDLKPGFLKLVGDFGSLKRELRMHALKYLNIGIGNKDWNEVEIRIYDKYGAYKLHYDRMMEVLEDLELGLVLGESWSKDYPKAMLAVEIYRVRLLTFNEPERIKRLLFGLEYLPDGTRIVDYDLYYRNEKVAWNKGLKNKKRSERNDEALAVRQEVLQRLNPETIAELERLEKEIIKTRY